MEYFGCLNYGVLDFERYVESVVGVKAAPVSPYEWMRIPESALYEITNRPVFLDESGFATACFLSFQRYPQDVLNKRLSACLYLMWEWGVKQLKRAEQRDDILASQMYWSRFVEYVIKILFLMNKKYAPYHKWLYKVAQQLPYLVLDILPLIFMGAQLEKRFDIVMDICQKLSEELGKAGYSKYTSKRPSVYSDATEILEYAADIRSSIKDDEIRAMHILQEIATPPTRPATTHVGIK